MKAGPLEFGEVIVMPTGRRAQVRAVSYGVVTAWYINNGRPDCDDVVEIRTDKVRRIERGLALPVRVVGG